TLLFAPIACDGGNSAGVRDAVSDAVSDAVIAARPMLRWELLSVGTREPPVLALRPCDGERGDPVVFPHLYGNHWAYAMLAALTVGEAVGVPRAEAVGALTALEPLPGRLRRLEGLESLTLLDDSHNATPASVAAGLSALDNLARAQGAARIAVLGDMLRLGDAEEAEHRRLGALAAERTDFLLTCGALAELVADEARRHGMPPERIAVTHTAEDGARTVRLFAAMVAPVSAMTKRAPVVYIKGS